MQRWRRLIAVIGVALLTLLVWQWGARAAPGTMEAGGEVIPLGEAQADLQAAYRYPLAHLYGGGRLWRSAVTTTVAARGDLYLPAAETATLDCPSCTTVVLDGEEPLTRAWALFPARVAVMRSSVRMPGDEGEVVAMWEIAEIRQVLDGYLMGAVPYDVLTETQLAESLTEYDLLILPAFRTDALAEVMGRLQESGAMDTMRAFVEEGGTIYAQGTALALLKAAGILPEGAVDMGQTIQAHLLPEDAFANRGVMRFLMPDDPMTYGLLTTTLYVLDDPFIYPDETMEVIADFTNLDYGPEAGVPALFRYPCGAGMVLGVVGHPTDPTRRLELPLFLNAMLEAMAGKVDFYGDAVQTFNPLYPPHEFPAYERVPVSATLHVGNLWDAPLISATLTETIAPGYRLITGTIVPTPTAVLSMPDGGTQIVWDFGALESHAELTISFEAETEPDTLAAGVSTFAQGTLSYRDGERTRTVEHRPFRLTARMAARLVGDRDLEPDRHFRIPQEGLYLDVALPLENKEETMASSLVMTDWVYLVAPIVDYADQHVILADNAGETIWMANEPYLWESGTYPLWKGASAPTQTITLEDWRALPPEMRPWCRFTSTYGIHTDAPFRARVPVTDYGSFVTIPPTYTDAITVTGDNELLLPCWPLVWELGDFPAYWYEEPAVRYGVHSHELLGREVVFEGTPDEGAVVIPNEAGSVYVAAGTETIPFREYMESAEPYAAQAPDPSRLTYEDVWSRTHTMTLRAIFYDVWDWDGCATCSPDLDQHAGANVTFGMWADMDGDGQYETPVREIPTRMSDVLIRYLAKTCSVDPNETGRTLTPTENLLLFPIFHGLGIRITPFAEDWASSYHPLAPGNAELISVTERADRDELFFRQTIPLGSHAAFVLSATITNYSFNREGQFKLDDGARLVYRQEAAGPNRYEVYDSHAHVVEGYRSDGEVGKWVGPTAVRVYSDTLLFLYHFRDPYEPRNWAENYDPSFKAWGYGDLVWSTYVGGKEEKRLYHSYLHAGEHTIVRLALENNTGITLTGVIPHLETPDGVTATLLYTDPATAPEPIWPELAFLNREVISDGWRSVWYFGLTVGEALTDSLWNRVVEIPVVVEADNLPDGYEAPPARVAFVREGGPIPLYVSAPSSQLVLTDALPANVVISAATWITDPATIAALQSAAAWDAAHPESDTVASLFATLTPTLGFQVDEEGGIVTFDLPEAARSMPPERYVAALARLERAHHGPNIVNEGPGITYRDPFGVQWSEQGHEATVEAHGAAVWVDYYCEGGWGESPLPASEDVLASNGTCYIPDYGPAEVLIRVTAYNAGDAIARGVTVTVELPEGITATYAIPMWQSVDGQEVLWQLGDLAPGAWRQFEIVLYIEPTWDFGGEGFSASALEPALLGWTEAIHESRSAFLDSFSQTPLSGQAGDAYLLGVRRVIKYVYLPTVFRTFAPYPDLTITALSVSADDPSTAEIELVNQGGSTAEAFWLDLYLDPVEPPEGNTAWESVSTYGASWFIPRLEPGEHLTLHIGDAWYRADDSRWPDHFASGEHTLWAYADSWGAPSSWGAVRESSEGNNRIGPVSFTAP